MCRLSLRLVSNTVLSCICYAFFWSSPALSGHPQLLIEDADLASVLMGSHIMALSCKPAAVAKLLMTLPKTLTVIAFPTQWPKVVALIVRRAWW